MKIQINGLHIAAAVISVLVWVFWLPAWPSLFIFVIGQCAATYLSRVVDYIREGSE